MRITNYMRVTQTYEHLGEFLAARLMCFKCPIRTGNIENTDCGNGKRTEYCYEAILEWLNDEREQAAQK